MPKTEIYEIEVVAVDDHIIIKWSSNIGWGEYTLTHKHDGWHGESEYMDRGSDKKFLTALLTEFVAQVTVEG